MMDGMSVFMVLIFLSLQAFDGDGERNSAFLDFDFEGVALFAFDVDVAQGGWDYDGDDFFAVIRFHADGDDGGGGSVFEEAFIDDAFDEKLSHSEAVAVFLEVTRREGFYVRERF